MFHFISNELNEIYQTDQKKLRTNTVLYGHLGEGRWHTHLQPPLPEEEVLQYEASLNQTFPSAYKEFLNTHNGCYLFDILRVAGEGPETYKGLSHEEQVHLAFELEYMQELYRRKRTPVDHFIFADSIEKNTYYVIDLNEQVLEIDFRTKKVLQTFESLKLFLKEIIQEGKSDIKEGFYYEFE